jgi:ribosome-binding factor A
MGRDRQRRRGASVLTDAARPSSKVPRRLRVERDLMTELSAALQRLHDPRTQGAGLTRVQLTDDLRYARVYVRLSYGADDSAKRTELIRAMDAAAGRLRRHVGRRLALRYTPELRFFYDEGPDAASRVDELLSEIRAENPPPVDVDEGDDSDPESGPESDPEGD